LPIDSDADFENAQLEKLRSLNSIAPKLKQQVLLLEML
jgi:hypothetical protein